MDSTRSKYTITIHTHRHTHTHTHNNTYDRKSQLSCACLEIYKEERGKENTHTMQEL